MLSWQKEDPWDPFTMIFLTATLRLWSLLILWIVHLPELCQGRGGGWTPQSELIRAVLGAEECPKIKGQVCCSGLPFPPPEDLPDPGIKPTSPAYPTWQVSSLPLSHLGSPRWSLGGNGGSNSIHLIGLMWGLKVRIYKNLNFVYFETLSLPISGQSFYQFQRQ